MKRYLSYAAMAVAIVIAACSDGPTDLANVNGGRTSFAASRNGPVDQLILKLFPRGIETATGARWDRVDIELGMWNETARSWQGSSVDQGHKHLIDLIKFIRLKTGDIESSGLAAGETKAQAADRLIAAMIGYAFGGPSVTPPEPGADVVIAVVPAGAEQTIVTPAEQAGLFLPAGATGEERVIVIAQSAPPTGAERCDGPLNYSGCQFPPFYRFESIPLTKLNTPGHFAVCMDLGPLGATEAEHSRIALAHDLPPSPILYTPGATQTEGIEILPLVPAGDQQGMLECEHPPVIGLRSVGERMLYAVDRFLSRHLSPKKAYAYDSGPEHFSGFFSNFVGVDPGIIGVWNGFLRPPGAETGGQPVTMILNQTSDGCVGEFRVGTVESNVAYNVTRTLTSCNVDGSSLVAEIDPWSAPTSDAVASEFAVTLSYNTLNGTAARVFVEDDELVTETPWTLNLTRSTTGTPTIIVMPALRSNLTTGEGGSTATLY